MNRINELFNQMEKIENEKREQLSDLETKIQSELNKVFDDWKDLQTAMTELESSNDYSLTESGLHSWIRFDLLSDCEEKHQYYLENYLSDCCIYIDFENDCLMRFEGDFIEINPDGDVFLSNHPGCSLLIIDVKEYSNDTERNELIEAYMERHGYFPGVFRTDRWGNVYPVDTQGEKNEASKRND